MGEKSAFGSPTIQNRKARFDYQVVETFEAGIMLTGSEVKSIRLGSVSIGEAFALERNGELFLTNATISPYAGANKFNHAPKRERKLLLKRKEINKIIGEITRSRLTLVPLELYFNAHGKIKCKIALVIGKKSYDKRQTEKDRDWARQKSRLLKE